MTGSSLFRAGVGLLSGTVLLLATLVATAATDGKPMPEFRHGTVPEAWLNSGPLRSQDLRGKVVLIDLFTTG